MNHSVFLFFRLAVFEVRHNFYSCCQISTCFYCYTVDTNFSSSIKCSFEVEDKGPYILYIESTEQQPFDSIESCKCENIELISRYI